MSVFGRTWEERYDDLRMKHDALQEEVHQLRGLAALCVKPTPKFQLEQVVISDHNGYLSSFWIHGMYYGQDAVSKEWGWFYTQQREEGKYYTRRYVAENKLRGLTDVEIGVTRVGSYDGQ